MSSEGNGGAMLSELRSAVSRAVIPIQTGGVVLQESLAALIAATERVVRSLKGQNLIDRNVAREIYFAERVLRAEAESLQDDLAPEVVAAADRLQHLFGLLMLDEGPEDRRPGVPRVI